jgi:hypothetical protein
VSLFIFIVQFFTAHASLVRRPKRPHCIGILNYANATMRFVHTPPSPTYHRDVVYEHLRDMRSDETNALPTLSMYAK